MNVSNGFRKLSKDDVMWITYAKQRIGLSNTSTSSPIHLPYICHTSTSAIELRTQPLASQGGGSSIIESSRSVRRAACCCCLQSPSSLSGCLPWQQRSRCSTWCVPSLPAHPPTQRLYSVGRSIFTAAREPARGFAGDAAMPRRNRSTSHLASCAGARWHPIPPSTGGY